MEDIHINFDPDDQAMLSILLAFIMYGVALDLQWENFRKSFAAPKAMIIGLLSQFVVLPALTFVLISVWQPLAGIALGLMLMAACPGGTISNFFSSLAKADVGLSVSMTMVATFLCLIMTPFNFSFYSRMHPLTQELAKEVSLDPIDLFSTVLTILIIPVILGMITRNRLPKLTQKIGRPIKLVSMVIFVGFVAMALFQNLETFAEYWGIVAAVVVVHNTIAIASGLGLGFLAKLPVPQRRSISIETGIQNSGLGLVISFTFFPEMGELALVCAMWGIWHITSGFTWAFLLRRIKG
jgi:BASS family bile acid:Na+ symporter